MIMIMITIIIIIMIIIIIIIIIIIMIIITVTIMIMIIITIIIVRTAIIIKSITKPNYRLVSALAEAFLTSNHSTHWARRAIKILQVVA